jgi:hypothetical protein
MKPFTALNFRISQDVCGKQRFTEQEVLDEMASGNAKIDGMILVRIHDGKVIGGFTDSINVFSKILADVERVNNLDTKSIPEKVLKFIEESADSLQVLISLQLAACKLKGIPYEKVLYALLEKNMKWEAKLSEYTRDKK